MTREDTDTEERRGNDRSQQPRDEESSSDRDTPVSSSNGRPSALRVVEKAKDQLSELIGKPADSVSATKRTDDGWGLTVEIVELERIPSTTDVLASYETDVDLEGNVVEYRRTRRYYRNRADDEQ